MTKEYEVIFDRQNNHRRMRQQIIHNFGKILEQPKISLSPGPRIQMSVLDD
jgi:hypothetical protein